MTDSMKEKPSYIVSREVLNQKGKFTLSDIVNKVRDALSEMFDTIEKIEKYVADKINAMCELGLVNKTEIYYFMN